MKVKNPFKTKIQAITYVVPAYNAQGTVRQSLNSILPNIKDSDELIIVDDCSTDDTFNVLQSFKKKNEGIDITIIKHVVNKGDGAARNTAIEASKNELFFCLDADNILRPGSVRPLANKLLKDKADAASFQELHYFKENPSKIELKWHFPHNIKYDLSYHLSHYQVPSASGNYLITKKAWVKYGRYPEYAGALNNWGFGLAQSANGAKTVILKDSFYFHRFGHESLWMRDEHAGKIPLIALQLLIPYLKLLEDEDVEYVFSKKGRTTWFGALEKRPLRVKRQKIN